MDCNRHNLKLASIQIDGLGGFNFILTGNSNANLKLVNNYLTLNVYDWFITRVTMFSDKQGKLIGLSLFDPV